MTSDLDQRTAPDGIESPSRQGMRAYLQRAEVRLSTMHRIAGIFINGAGLLVLLPFLFKDAVEKIAGFLLAHMMTGRLVDFSVYLIAAVPFLISLAIPLYALYLLIKDLVYFYFVSSTPGFPTTFFNPRFSLAAIALPKDEVDPVTMREIFRLQYNTDLIHFVLPLNQNLAVNFSEFAKANDDIIPETRKEKKLEELGIDIETDQSTLRAFNVALGLSGFLDRRLIEEVARSEVSLVRHAIALRRLVLRYIKTLLALIWTTIISFSAITVISVMSTRGMADTTILLFTATLYGAWSFLMPQVIRLPIRWLFQHNPQLKPVRDIELVRFERQVNIFSIVGMLASISTMVVCVLAINGAISF